MLKLVGFRFSIGLIALLAVIAGVVFTVRDRSVPGLAVTQDDQDWRYERLIFLKAAYDRLDAELARQPNSPGATSLKGEQQELLRLMEETAQPIAENQIPAAVRPLLQRREPGPAVPAATEPPPAAPAPVATASSPDLHASPPELRPGAGFAFNPGLDLSGLSREPALDIPVIRPRAAPPAKAEKPAKNAGNSQEAPRREP
jgi:hypothetical protein